MKPIIVAAVILFVLLLSQCSFLSKSEAALQEWQMKETPLGTELSVIMGRHKKELNGSNKYWSYSENGCTYGTYANFHKQKKQPGYMIHGVLDTRLYFIVPEYVFVIYCFDENKKLTSVNVNVEVDGI